MSIISAFSLSLVMLTFALLPSASVGLVITRSITHNVANGIAASIGIVCGDLVFILLVVLGLSYIAETFWWLFVTIKYIGASFLIWFGYRLLRSDKISSSDSKAKQSNRTNKTSSLLASYLAGFILTLGDVKAIFFYIGLLPMFINLAYLELRDVILLMSITSATVGSAKFFYAVSAIKLTDKAQGFKFEAQTKTLAGIFMITAGGFLIVKA